MKYRPGFPERFHSMDEARAFCQTFFSWYNYEHRHSGIGYMTPAAMHNEVAPIIYEQRDSPGRSQIRQSCSAPATYRHATLRSDCPANRTRQLRPQCL
jgi:hypothetical protein